MWRVEKSEKEIESIKSLIEDINIACDIIQDGAGCEHCPIHGTYCLADTLINEIHCIPTDLIVEFFGMAGDVDKYLSDVEADIEGCYEE